MAVRYEREGGIAKIIFNRPEVLNALDLATLASLAEVTAEVAADDTVRVVLLTGAGRAFCAGGDVKAMAMGGGAGSPVQLARQGTNHLHLAASALYRMGKPTVALVNGPAAGAGVGLALACDIVWAAQSAHFTLAYTRIGLSPDGSSSFFVPRAVGLKRAAELFLTNRRVDADEALQIGLCSRVIADDAIAAETQALLEQLERSATAANGRLKHLLRTTLLQGLETQLEDERAGIIASFQGPEIAEGLMAFLGRREPDFRPK